MANCANGKQEKISGGLFYICQYGKHKGNHCQFVRLCKKTQLFKQSAINCSDFSTKKAY